MTGTRSPETAGDPEGSHAETRPATAGEPQSEGGRRILIVSTVERPEVVLRRYVEPDDAIKVVVPVVRQGILDWLANDERAFAHAQDVAARAGSELPAEKPSKRPPARPISTSPSRTPSRRSTQTRS